MSNVSKAALALFDAGIITIPIALDGSKRPIGMWGKFAEEPPARAQVELIFKRHCGIAVLCGPTSGGLECIDFDQPGYFESFAELVNDIAPWLLDKLCRIQTPRGDGYHLYYRTDAIQGNQKLAFLLIDGKKQTAIETRGKGGYAIIPPSPAEAHPTKRQYKHVGGPTLANVQRITNEEREILLSAAQSMNLVSEDSKDDKASQPSVDGSDLRPGDDYNLRAEWRPLLEKHGWSVIRNRGEVTHWQRPGKDGKGISATTGHCGDKLYVFSSNAAPFESGRTCSKFWAYALLEHGGDFKAASKQARKDGYGSPLKRKSTPPVAQINNQVPPHDIAPMPSDDDAPPPDVIPLSVDEAERIACDKPGWFLSGEGFPRLLATREHKSLWMSVLDVFRRTKIRRDIEKELKAYDKRESLRSAVAYDGVEDLIPLLTKNAPASGAPIVPREYVIKPESGRGEYKLYRFEIRERKDGPVKIFFPVCDRIPILSAILHHENGSREIECAWPDMGSGVWQKRAIRFEHAFDGGEIVKALVPYGFPVTSQTRHEMVRWLDAYMRTNEHELEHRQVSESCGYQRSGGFLLGEEFIGSDSDRPVDFAAAGDGEEQIVEGLQSTKGTRDAWIKMLHAVHGRPKLEIALYASLAAPLLKPLDASNFAIEWAGKTSGGKTTALRLAASVWGQNNESESSSLIQTWSTTVVGAERYMETLCDLPVLLDDTQAAEERNGKRPTLERVIYQLTSGGKMRGDKVGSRSRGKWRTVLLSTGEQKITDMVKGGGAAARVLTVWGSPTDGMSGAEVGKLRSEMSANFGHIGRDWIRFIVDNEDKWPQWQALHSELQAKYMNDPRMLGLADQGIAGRMANYMAVLGVAAQLAIDALDLPWGADETDPVAACVADFAEEMEQDSRTDRAMEDMVDFLGAHKASIQGTHEAKQNGSKPPPSGWIGVLRHGQYLDAFTTQLRELLETLGHHGKATLRHWADDGRLIREGKSIRLRVRDPDTQETVSVYRFKLQTIEDYGLTFSAPNGKTGSFHEPQERLSTEAV